MNYNIAFYIHHHGSGHLMRALAIAGKLDHPVTFLGSGLGAFKDQIPSDIICIDLPEDIPSADDDTRLEGPAVDALHYAPLNVGGIRERNRLLISFFTDNYPLLLIVDVSVEIALLARLCSIPAVVMRQHGDRNDAAHLIAYQSAVMLIAPFPESLRPLTFPWVDEKTYFSGGFSRYSSGNYLFDSAVRSFNVAVMTGKGGTTIGETHIAHLAATCPTWHFHVLGVLPANDISAVNITIHGRPDDPSLVLKTCMIVIGNAGHNTVMEMADLKKAFICIPEERPFNEQLQKATLLQANHGVPIVLPADFFHTDWNRLFSETVATPPDWRGMINPGALKGISIALDQVASTLF